MFRLSVLICIATLPLFVILAQERRCPAGAPLLALTPTKDANTGTIVIADADGRSYSWKSAVRSGIIRLT